MADVTERERMANSWWTVLGEYSGLDDRGKKVRLSFNSDYWASNKNDAISQARKQFVEMQLDDPEAQYNNLVKLRAIPN